MRSLSVSQKQQQHSQNNHVEIKEIKSKHGDETKTSFPVNKACIFCPYAWQLSQSCAKSIVKSATPGLRSGAGREWEGSLSMTHVHTWVKRAPWGEHAAALQIPGWGCSCRLETPFYTVFRHIFPQINKRGPRSELRYWNHEQAWYTSASPLPDHTQTPPCSSFQCHIQTQTSNTAL